MEFADTMLIDDRADNCAAFTGQGGAAIQWKMGTDDISEVTSQLRQWVNPDASASAHAAQGAPVTG
jgi:hypothetical protein